MPKPRSISGKSLIKILEKLGYRATRQRGSHVRLECFGRKSVTVPDYKAIDKSLIRKILRDAELSVEEFEKLQVAK
ncbi:type II toxin-antitoxin system HicA family toxin [Candidatus Azambacteria bacterium]|nr:type II toxin-antitoxin system HicA family toxin [Candidatus Azambacteria bacterium]